jgi:hypothetical protein
MTKILVYTGNMFPFINDYHIYYWWCWKEGLETEWIQGILQWKKNPTEFHGNWLVCSKVSGCIYTGSIQYMCVYQFVILFCFSGKSLISDAHTDFLQYENYCHIVYIQNKIVYWIFSGYPYFSHTHICPFPLSTHV